MKIDTVEAVVFGHATNTVRDSDGHGHPGPEGRGTSALLTQPSSETCGASPVSAR